MDFNVGGHGGNSIFQVQIKFISKKFYEIPMNAVEFIVIDSVALLRQYFYLKKKQCDRST